MSSKKETRKRQMASATAKAKKVAQAQGKHHEVKTDVWEDAQGWKAQVKTRMAWSATWSNGDVERFDGELEAWHEMNKVQIRFQGMGWRVI